MLVSIYISFLDNFAFLTPVKRNITKAIKIANHLIDAHIKNANGMEEMVKDWKTDTKGLGLEIASVHRDVAKCIEQIVIALQPSTPKEKKLVKAIS